MITVWKLTTADNKTRKGGYNETTWGENVTHEVGGLGTKLCTSDVIHAYRHPVLAVLLNPAHAAFHNPKLWKCKTPKIVAEKADKCGVKRLTTLECVPLPQVTTEQLVSFAIHVALLCHHNDSGFVKWANAWLDGSDRSATVAYSAVVQARATVATPAAGYAATAASAAAELRATDAAYAAALVGAYAVDLTYKDLTYKDLLKCAGKAGISV